MEVVCAGQFHPWRWSDDRWEPVRAPTNLPLGIFPKYEAEITVFPCLPGEKWLLFTDGINEGRSPSGTDYGFDRLRRSLGLSSAADVLNRAWALWKSFVDGVELHDDACMALVVTKPPSDLQIQSAPGQCKIAREYVEAWARAAGYPDLERGRIVLAADEAITNIIRHTYQDAHDKTIILSAQVTPTEFHLHLRDHGTPVDAKKFKGRELEDLKPGGLGLHLLKMVFTTVEHTPLPDGNQWHLAKPLPAHDHPPKESTEK